MDEHVVLVVPSDRRYMRESENRKGRPATHVIDPVNPQQTLCKRNPQGWDVFTDGVLTLDTRQIIEQGCAGCYRAWQKRQTS